VTLRRVSQLDDQRKVKQADSYACLFPQISLNEAGVHRASSIKVAENTVKKLIKVGKAVKGAQVLILGLTFKENVGDIRNTKVVDIVSELGEYGVESLVFDPYADAEEVRHEYGLEILPSLAEVPAVDAVILAVPHDKFKELTLDKLASFCRKGATPIVVDIKGMFDPETATKQGVRYWRL